MGLQRTRSCGLPGVRRPLQDVIRDSIAPYSKMGGLQSPLSATTLRASDNQSRSNTSSFLDHPLSKLSSSSNQSLSNTSSSSDLPTMTSSSSGSDVSWDSGSGDERDRQLADSWQMSARQLSADAKLGGTHGQAKCAFFSHSLERNGANMCLLHLCKWLVGESEVDLISPKDGPMKADFELLGVNCSVISPSKGMPKERQLLQQAQYSFVICNTIMRADVAVLAEEMGIPCVWIVHEAWPQDQFEYYAKKVFLMDHIDAGLLHKAFGLCTRIVFPANIQKDLYAGLYQEDAAVCIYNGIPLDAIDEFARNNDRNGTRRALGYAPDDFLIVQVGTVCHRKGQLFTARAFARLTASGAHPNAKLLMVGARYIRDHEIRYIQEIKAVVAEAGLEDRVKILDCQDEVFQFYLAADVVLQPSLNEVLPLCVCEAMAFQRPVIATRIDGIPEAIEDQIEGLLIPPSDEVSLERAIRFLATDENARAKMGFNGRKRVLEQFDYDTMIPQYKNLVNEIVENDVRVHNIGSSIGGFPEAGQKEEATTVLVDLDNTVVDWDKEFIKRWLAAGNPQSDADIVRTREHFEIELTFEPEQREQVLEVIAQRGFYAQLEPFPGAVEALQTMVQCGVDVKLVTAPHPSCLAQCTVEKYEWVAKHLGESWFKRLIITMDKTAVQGAILIDDKPAVKGSMKPTWEHVLFKAPYNARVRGKPKLGSWKDWERVVDAPRQRTVSSRCGA